MQQQQAQFRDASPYSSSSLYGGLNPPTLGGASSTSDVGDYGPPLPPSQPLYEGQQQRWVEFCEVIR